MNVFAMQVQHNDIGYRQLSADRMFAVFRRVDRIDRTRIDLIFAIEKLFPARVIFN